ncbi:hypothetical protein AMTR_s00073p00110620 [Amborella trichopoda]|uniref:Uncharacterized protein n=1 Tax=Amborella trichopoda TaxID=13333 RepID=W1NRJ4_AMBTC|nr:hypothetical protein AMTR_s00073p00110620 [Amborella trichopoda]
MAIEGEKSRTTMGHVVVIDHATIVHTKKRRCAVMVHVKKRRCTVIAHAKKRRHVVIVQAKKRIVHAKTMRHIAVGAVKARNDTGGKTTCTRELKDGQCHVSIVS